jgi:hypothetical protein
LGRILFLSGHFLIGEKHERGSTDRNRNRSHAQHYGRVFRIFEPSRNSEPHAHRGRGGSCFHFQSGWPIAETEIKGRAFFKERIHFFWNKTIDAILDTGWTLVEAQASLSPEEWSKFVKNDVPFDYSILRKLMKTVQSTNISDPKYKDRLPASWTCLHEIALMTPSTFQLALQKGFIDRTKFG